MNKQDLIDAFEASEYKEIELAVHHSDKPWVKLEVPELKDKHKGGRLENWIGVESGGEIFRVIGSIYNDERWFDGKHIETSYVVNLQYDEETESGILETRNTVYTLGKKWKNL